MTKETWKKVSGRAEGFPYEVSSLGRVRRIETGYILKPTKGPKGYYRVNLRDSPRRYNVTLHILVADAFLEPPPGPIGSKAGEWQIDHEDDDKSNNTVSNLEWVTKTENRRRATQNGLFPKGAEHHNAKLVENDVVEIRNLYASGNYSQYDLADKYDVHVMQINRIVNRKRWTHL